MHKMRRAMVRPGRDKLTEAVKVDETYVGGRGEDVHGRETEDKAIVVIAAEIRGGKTGHIRLRRVEDLCWTTDDIEWLSVKDQWSQLQSICMMKTQRMIGEQRSEETLLYISSLKPKAQLIAEVVRKPWGIENSLHRVLDIAFREDECRKRKDHSAENSAMLRRITLNLLKQENA